MSLGRGFIPSRFPTAAGGSLRVHLLQDPSAAIFVDAAGRSYIPM